MVANSRTGRRIFRPIEQRDAATVRAIILARTSDPSGTMDDVESQVQQCCAFIERMGWRLVADPYAYAERKTGMRRVKRPVLTQVLSLAQSGQIDVIVCLAVARVDRTRRRRYHAIVTAEQFGVQFRFVNRPPDGKLPEGTVGLLQELQEDLFDEQEARKIVERLTPGKLARYEQGMPHGGRAGPLFGYGEGERPARKHGRQRGLISWVVDEAKAQWVRWLYATVDATPDPAKVSLRHMAQHLDLHNVPTPTGEGSWSVKQISNILRNPKYCGRGRNLRYRVEWGTYREESTGEVYDDKRLYDRMRHEDEWTTQTFPIPETAIPRIIEPDQWDRVQAKLDEGKAYRGKVGRAGSAHREDETLLNGLVRCAQCGIRMTRYYRSDSDPTPHRRGVPYYRCSRNSVLPGHPCKLHVAPARDVDDIVYRLLAHALTDPDKAVQLADAAEQQYEQASAEFELASAELEAYRREMDRIETKHRSLTTALKALSAADDMDVDAMIADIREKIARLDEEREQAEADHKRAIPQREQAT